MFSQAIDYGGAGRRWNCASLQSGRSRVWSSGPDQHSLYCLYLANGYILARLGVEVMVPSPVGDLKSVPLISTFLALSLAENLTPLCQSETITTNLLPCFFPPVASANPLSDWFLFFYLNADWPN